MNPVKNINKARGLLSFPLKSVWLIGKTLGRQDNFVEARM